MPDDPYAAYQQADPYAAYQVPSGEKDNGPMSVGGFLGNAVSSAGNVIGQTANAIMHPIDTGTNIAKLGMGAVEKVAARPLVSAIKGQDIPKTPEEQQLDSVIDFYRQRYGGMKNVGQTLYQDPVGAALDASAVLGGGSAALRGAAGVADAANAGRLAGALRTGAGAAGRVAVETNPIVQGGRAAIGAGKLAARAGSTVIPEVLGKTTGVGSSTIKQALANPSPDLVNAMRGGLSDTDMVEHFRDALQNVKDARSADYQQRLAQIPQTVQLDITPVRDALNRGLANHNVRVLPNGDLDFSRSTLRDPASQAIVQGMHEDLSGWGSQPGDLTPRGVDILKRRVDDVYAPTNNARSIVQSVKATTRDVLNQGVPGYPEMTGGYADASKFLDQLKDLSLESSNPGTAVRKLTTLLNQNNGYRQALIDHLSQFTPADLQGELAGQALSKWAPRGIMGPASGIGLIYGVASHAISPVSALATAATSPRLMGELMVALSKLRPSGPVLPSAASVSPNVGTASRVLALPAQNNRADAQRNAPNQGGSVIVSPGPIR